MDLLGNEELQRRIKNSTASIGRTKPEKNLTIVEFGDSFRIDTLVCEGFPALQASVLLLTCKGLSYKQIAKVLGKGTGNVVNAARSITLKILGSNENGNTEGSMAATVTQAFIQGNLYFSNKSVFVSENIVE